MVAPAVVGPRSPARADSPAARFFEHPEHAVLCDANARTRAAIRTQARPSRYKGGVVLLRRSLCVTLITLALICSIRDARANGRFPRAQAIVSVPGSDGSTVFLRATFGILVSRDAGKTWKWICERSLGYEGAWDPPIAVTRDGRLWVGLERGLVSTVDGCSVQTSDELAGEQIKDLTTDPKGETLWALTGAPDKRGAVWRRTVTADAGARWERMGLMPDDIHPMTLEIAPSKPSRIYVTAQPYGTVRGWLWKSDDGGKTFTGGKNDLAETGPLFIAAVDPKDPNRVVLRHLHSTGSKVLVTTNGGKTFKETLSIDSAMFGFAKSSDGATLYAGSGLAKDGIFRSTDRGEHFERMSNHGVLCLHAAPGAGGGRLFVCENPFNLGAPAIAVSTDHGQTVSPLARFADIQGPLACGRDAATPDASVGLCAEAWPETFAMFVPRDGGVKATDGGTRPRRDAGSDGGGASGAAPPSSSRKTCGCAVIGAAESGPDRAWLTAGLLPLAMWGRARRRRGSSRNQSGPSRAG